MNRTHLGFRPSVAAPRRAGKKFESISRTFTNPNPIATADTTTAAPYPSTIPVTGFEKGTIKDGDLTLFNDNHGWPDDVDVLLGAPGGRGAVVLSDGGADPDPVNPTIGLDDQAPSGLPDGRPLGAGTFKPTNANDGADPFPPPRADSANSVLAASDGINPNGIRRLSVVDGAAIGTGNFNGGRSLRITAKVKKAKQ